MENQQAFNPFDILNTPWGKLPLGNAIPGVGSFNFTDLKEMDKRIAELKAVEQWLSLNLSMLKTTIQGLEVQRGTLAALQSFTESMTTPAKGKPTTGDGPRAATAATAATNPFAIPVSFSNGQVTPAAEQASAWWDAIQQQFGQMMVAAQASAQSMMDPQPKAQKKPAKKSDEKSTEPKAGD